MSEPIDGIGDDWSLIMAEDKMRERAKEKAQAQAPKRRKPLFGFMETAKSKLYNMYKSYPREVATFSVEPLWLLGAHYDPEAMCKRRIADTHMHQACLRAPKVNGSHRPGLSASSGRLSNSSSARRRALSRPVRTANVPLKEEAEPATKPAMGGHRKTTSIGGLTKLEESKDAADGRVGDEKKEETSEVAEESQDDESVGGKAESESGVETQDLTKECVESVIESHGMTDSDEQQLATSQERLARRVLSEGSEEALNVSLSVPVKQHRRQRSLEDAERQKQYKRFLEMALVPKDTQLTVASAELRPFMLDFVSQLWVTYRSHFPPLKFSDITSDMGWGCMVRSGQMMLARALVSLVLGRDWRLAKQENSVHRTILNWFVDRPGASHPYSIHNIMQVAACLRLMPGEWFGPSTICRVLKFLVRTHSPNSMTMYVAREYVIYRDAIIALCQTKPRTMFSPKLPKRTKKGPRLSEGGESLSLRDDEERDEDAPTTVKPKDYFRPVLIVVPVRLGLGTLNAEYKQHIKEFLTYPQSVGIIGGKPNSSFYFIGSQGDDLIYLDPHRVHPSADPSDADGFPTDTFHCRTPHKIPVGNIDPSMAIGFFCKDKADFDDLCVRVKEQQLRDKMMTVFTVEDKTPGDESDEEDRDRMDAELAKVAASILLL